MWNAGLLALGHGLIGPIFTAIKLHSPNIPIMPTLSLSMASTAMPMWEMTSLAPTSPPLPPPSNPFILAWKKKSMGSEAEAAALASVDTLLAEVEGWPVVEAIVHSSEYGGKALSSEALRVR